MATKKKTTKKKTANKKPSKKKTAKKKTAKKAYLAKNKTKASGVRPAGFLSGIVDDQRRKDCQRIAGWMKKATKSSGKMWGASIVGYGAYTASYESGRTFDWFYVGFSNRKQSITLYIMNGFSDYEPLIKKLGKVSHGKSCLYLKRLSDVNEDVLQKLINSSVKYMTSKHG